MFRKLSSYLLIICLVTTIISPISFAKTKRKNPSREVLEEKIEDIARRKGVPSVLLKSIARVESIYQQYNSDGSVFTGPSGSIGLMQIYNAYGWFDTDKLKNDVDYNIEAGAEVLLKKWDDAVHRLPSIGNMDPNVLENWYFAIWAYNGWLARNNPNATSKKYTYPQLIYMIAEEEYGQDITEIDPKLLPGSGRPSRSTHFDTPSPAHKANIEMYHKGDLVKVDVISGSLSLRDAPRGNTIGSLKDETMLEVISEPKLEGGYYRYKVKEIDGDRQGWVTGNWISKTGSKYPFTDISGSWAKDYILKLNEQGIILGDGKSKFEPKKELTREEVAVLITKGFRLNGNEYKLKYKDKNKISKSAMESVKAVSDMRVMGGYEDGTFRPKAKLYRKDAAFMARNLLRVVESKLKPKEDIKYKDIDELSEAYKEAINFVSANNIMTGKDGFFRPNDYITKADISKFIIEIMDLLGKHFM